MNENVYISDTFGNRCFKLIIKNYKFILLYLLFVFTPSLLIFMTKSYTSFVLKESVYRQLMYTYIIFFIFVVSPVLRKIYLDLAMNKSVKLSNISIKSLIKVAVIRIIKLLFFLLFFILGIALLRVQSLAIIMLVAIIFISFLFYIGIRSYFAIEFVLARKLTIKESFKQSWNLTQNNFWRISLYFLIVSAISTILSYIFLLSIPFLCIVDSVMFTKLLNLNK